MSDRVPGYHKHLVRLWGQEEMWRSNGGRQSDDRVPGYNKHLVRYGDKRQSDYRGPGVPGYHKHLVR